MHLYIFNNGSPITWFTNNIDTTWLSGFYTLVLAAACPKRVSTLRIAGYSGARTSAWLTPIGQISNTY